MYSPLSLSEQFDAIQAEIATADGFSALGACIFAGGFSFGMEEAGLHVCGHMELPDLALGAEACKARWPVAVAPLRDGYDHGLKSDMAMGNTWLDFVDRLKHDDTVPDVLYANPPCVAFAGTGKHAGTGDDRMCYTRYCSYELAFRLQPHVWTWELVPGVFTRERSFLDAMAFRARSLGYRCYAFLTTSAIHGGFQDRRRFHFVASKFELDFEGVYDREPDERKASLTLGDALEVVKRARREMADEMKLDPDENNPELLDLLPNDKNLYGGAFTDIMPFCPPGSHLRDVPESIMHDHYRPRGKKWTGRGKPGFGHTRGRMDRPSPNVLGGHTIIHPESDRYLTPRECATVQGFPIDFRFTESTKAYAEIGKGLCTHNASFLGRVIKDALERNIRTVPTKSDEKGHENSWLQAIDWRRRGKKLSIKMPPEDQAEWWNMRHPDVPVPKTLGERA